MAQQDDFQAQAETEISKARMVELCVNGGQWELANAALKLPGAYDAKSEQAVSALAKSVEGTRSSYAVWHEKTGARDFAISLIHLGVDPCAPFAKDTGGWRASGPTCALHLAVQVRAWGVASAIAQALGEKKGEGLKALRERGFGLAAACACGPEGIRALLEFGESPNAQESGAPWAHHCANEGSLKALAEGGADLSSVDVKGAGLEEKLAKLADPKERALMFAYVGAIKGAKKKGDPVSDSETRAIFELAGKSSKAELFKELRRLGLKPDQALDASGRSLLARAMRDGNWRGVVALVDAGLDPMRIAPSGEPEACYLLARKSVNARSMSAEQKKERAAMEAVEKRVPAGWRSSKGLSLAEELVSNAGALSYAARLPIRSSSSARDAFDQAGLMWFARREPRVPGEPLAAQFLKEPSSAWSAFKVMSVRASEPFESGDGACCLEKALVAYFKERLSRECEMSETTQLARVAMEWGGWESPSVAAEAAKRGEALRSGPMMDRVFAKVIEIALGESAQEPSYSAGGRRDVAWALREFAQAAQAKGWKPNFETIGPLIADSMQKASAAGRAQGYWERPLEMLFFAYLPHSARLALDVIASESSLSGDCRAARAGLDWLNRAFERNQELVFPATHPLFGRAVPEWLAKKEVWLKVEQAALKSSAQEAGKRGPSVRI